MSGGKTGRQSSVEPSRELGPVRLAILDDHELLLDSMGSWISANAPDFDLVLASRTWLGLVQSYRFPTDLIFLDFQLKESISIEARVRTCRAAGMKVIVLSSFDTIDARDRALAAGAEVFLTKSMPLQEVMAVARTVMGMPAVSEPPEGWLSPVPGAPELKSVKLSESEKRALILYVSGLSTQEVAEKMDVQFETAKTFLRRIRQKYARAGKTASKRTDLLLRAAEDGYLE
ncbi:MAG: response regulator transcription factor [Cryobacterium sp.]|nr:response regulator transcription factor [Cryobacterium sp.]MBX3116945.1 response regulator transcription factor [Cryobacterium sp.]